MSFLDDIPLPDDIELKVSRSERKALMVELTNELVIRTTYTIAQVIKILLLSILIIYVYESVTSQVVLVNFNYNIIIYLSLGWLILMSTIVLYVISHFNDYIKRKLKG